MKKLLSKFIFFSGGLLSGMSIINKYIFLSEEKKYIKKNAKQNKHFYESRYGKINYKIMGKGEPMLLIHSLFIGASFEEWNKNINFLSKHFKLYIIDLLGFGSSDKPKISYSSYLYVQIINDFILNIIKEPVHLLASSHSADLAIMAYNFNKNMYKSMILISPTGIGNNYKAVKNAEFKKFILELPIIGTSFYNYITSKNKLKLYIEKYSFSHKISKETTNTLFNNCHIGGTGNKYVLSALIAGYLNTNIEAQIKTIKIPTYIIWGNNNKLNSVKKLKYIHKLNSSISTSIYENARTFPNIESYDEFNESIINFLK